MLDADVLMVLDRLEAAGLVVWLDGGWGVDALVGVQTRPHRDLDLAIARDDRPAAQAALAAAGFERDPTVVPGLPARVLLADGHGRQVDLHLLVFDGHGNGWHEVGEDAWGGCWPSGSGWPCPRPCSTADVGARDTAVVGCARRAVWPPWSRPRRPPPASTEEASLHRFHRLARLLVVPVALAALLAAAEPAQAAPGDWWQFGTTAAGTRFNPNETAIGAANVARLVVGAEQVPTFGAGATFAHASGVAVADGRAYVQVGDFESGSSALLAYNIGAFRSPPLWQQRSGCNNASPTVHLSIVFVGAIACRPSGDDGGVRAFDAATGRQLWYSHELGIGNGTEDASNVAATSGAIYFSLYENAVYGGDDALMSLDARTGAVRWQAPGVFGAPAVGGGRVFAGVGANLQARSASTGALLWSRPGGSFGVLPTVTGDAVYSIGLEGATWTLFARSVSNGALRWKRAVGGSGGLAVAGGRVVVATGSGLRAVDAASGALRWNVAVAASGAPAVANGLVYAGLQQGIGAWRLSDGAQRWRSGTIPYGSPSVSGGRVYATGVRSADDRYAVVVDQFRLGA